jgi:predicted RNase H-like HicB family nuclease
MRFTVTIERHEDCFIGYCPEVPGANGQGRTIEECVENLREAIVLILEDRGEDPPDFDGSSVPT